MSEKRALCCGLPPVYVQRRLSPSARPAVSDPHRAALISIISKKWAPGTVIRFWIWRGEPQAWVPNADDAARFLAAVKRVNDLNLCISLQQVDRKEDADARIGFYQDGTSWSLVGTDNVGLDEAKDPGTRTMNFGWPLRDQPGTEDHELWHLLGFSHEHQNPRSGIKWNRDAVYEEFSGPPNNWDKDTIDWNILNPLTSSVGARLEGSAWDPKSIMEYTFPAKCIAGPSPYDQTGIPYNAVASATDIKWIKRIYPPRGTAAPLVPVATASAAADGRTYLTPFVSRVLDVQAGVGAVVEFLFRPSISRTYTVRSLGVGDCSITAFNAKTSIFIANNDNVGAEPARDASITARFLAGEEYAISVRASWAAQGQLAVVVI